jgi:mannose-6-phosphate isomerase-like protein (cupin superfamily)
MRYKVPMDGRSLWPAQLDALRAAPAQHRLVLENDQVRVLDTRIEPGEQTAVHTHQWPAVHHVISWSPFVRRDDQGAVLLDTRTAGVAAPPGTVLWGEPLGPHTLENVGHEPLHILSIEIKPSE